VHEPPAAWWSAELALGTTYRVVVTDQRAPRDGRIIENLGFFNPRTEPETVQIDAERARYWLSVGAQPSMAVARLLKASGVEKMSSAAQVA